MSGQNNKDPDLSGIANPPVRATPEVQDKLSKIAESLSGAGLHAAASRLHNLLKETQTVADANPGAVGLAVVARPSPSSDF